VRSPRHVFATFGLVLAAPLACGLLADESGATVPGASTSDAAADANEAGSPLTPDEQPTPTFTKIRCVPDGGRLSPSGAPCDPSRIVVVAGRGGILAGCGWTETYCDALYYPLGAGEDGFADAAAPAGFACGRAELGVRSCSYEFADTGDKRLDNEAVEAACRVTQLYAEKSVICQVYD